MELGEPDASGRRRPVEIPNSEFDIDVDTVGYRYWSRTKSIDTVNYSRYADK